MKDNRSIAVALFVLVLLLAAIVAVVLAVSGVDHPTAPPPIVDRPTAPSPISVPDPIENYLYRVGWQRYGSCLHAAVEDLLIAQGRRDVAAYWKSHYGGPATLSTVTRIADTLHLKHAETAAGDERFLEYCTAHRLGAAIYWQCDEPGDHAIVFCGFAADQAVLLGTNRPQVTRMPRQEFLARWRACGGGAFTILNN